MQLHWLCTFDSGHWCILHVIWSNSTHSPRQQFVSAQILRNDPQLLTDSCLGSHRTYWCVEYPSSWTQAMSQSAPHAWCPPHSERRRGWFPARQRLCWHSWTHTYTTHVDPQFKKKSQNWQYTSESNITVHHESIEFFIRSATHAILRGYQCRFFLSKASHTESTST